MSITNDLSSFVGMVRPAQQAQLQEGVLGLEI
jgi:hypothetical protein